MTPLVTIPPQETPVASPTSARKASVSSVPSVPKPPTFAIRHGRRYHGDENIPYYLPCDIKELSRQALFHELQHEIFGEYFCAEFSDENIPGKVLEIGCGTAVWSASVADNFAARGRPDVQFVGMDIVPVYGEMPNVNFTFVNHSFQEFPLPFPDNEFDYVFCRELSLAIPFTSIWSDSTYLVECLRILRPGGTLELQCSDLCIRALQPTTTPYIPGSSGYLLTPAIQLAMNVENRFIQNWNERIAKMCAGFGLSALPCTLTGPLLLMEEHIVGMQNKRVAVPLDEIWWESADSLDNIIPNSEKQKSADGSPTSCKRKNSVSMNRRSSTSIGSENASPLTEEEKAVRMMTKLTFTQMIESFEPWLREANGIAIDDWDRWYKDLMVDFFENRGLRGGECVEFGSWWGTKASIETKS